MSFSIFSVIFTIFVVPETKGKTLDEITVGNKLAESNNE
jgi:hypothetical protein